MVYTTLEVLRLAGVETPEEKLGKVSVSIGGVVSNDPDKLVNLQNATSVEVIVGKQSYDVTLPESNEPSEEVLRVRKSQGNKVLTQAEENRKAKRARREKPVREEEASE